MLAGNFNQRVGMRNGVFSQVLRLLGKTAGLSVLFALLFGANRGSGDEIAFTEYQVKAGFLFNFAKYVVWPAEAFTNASAPITIGLVGGDKFGDILSEAVKDKNVDGRKIEVHRFEKNSDLGLCHILFVSALEKKRLPAILARCKSRPVLTVGETEEFLQNGGMIHFKKKQGKIRLEIDLGAAQLAQLEISSKLLTVADVVKRKL